MSLMMPPTFYLQKPKNFLAQPVQSINTQFDENDLSVAEFELHRKIVRPLGSAILPWIAAATPREVVAFSTHNTERQAAFQQSINRDQKDLRTAASVSPSNDRRTIWQPIPRLRD